MDNIRKCPICGNYGEDLVFSFYCSNKFCRNFNNNCILLNKSSKSYFYNIGNITSINKNELYYYKITKVPIIIYTMVNNKKLKYITTDIFFYKYGCVDNKAIKGIKNED